MNQPYPYTTPQILTESLFVQYGGHTGSATSSQVTAAMTIAEKQMTDALHAYLVTTTITGSYPLPSIDSNFSLDAALIQSIGKVMLVSHALCSCEDSISTGTACIDLIDARRGVVHARPSLANFVNSCPCSEGTYPYKLQIVFTSGFDNGYVLNQPSLLTGLAMAAELVLQQISDPGAAEGGPGDPGISSWASLKYSEKRIEPKTTPFGVSARANYIMNLVRNYVIILGGKLGW